MVKLYLLVLSLIAYQEAFCEGEYHITTASDLIQFSKIVNNGTSYSGTTVFLDADIDFSGYI